MTSRTGRFARFTGLAACACFTCLAHAEPIGIPDRLQLEPPAGWKRAEPGEQPEVVKRNYGLRADASAAAQTLPALFFTGPPHQGFTPFLGVRLVPATWPLTEAGVARFTEEQQKLLQPLGGRVLLTRLIDVGARKAIRSEARYRPHDVDTALTTVVFPLRSGSALVAFVMHTEAEAALRPGIDACIATLEGREPWHAGLFGGRLFTYALIATVATAILVLLLRRRRARTR